MLVHTGSRPPLAAPAKIPDQRRANTKGPEGERGEHRKRDFRASDVARLPESSSPPLLPPEPAAAGRHQSGRYGQMTRESFMVGPGVVTYTGTQPRKPTGLSRKRDPSAGTLRAGTCVQATWASSQVKKNQAYQSGRIIPALCNQINNQHDDPSGSHSARNRLGEGTFTVHGDALSRALFFFLMN